MSDRVVLELAMFCAGAIVMLSGAVGWALIRRAVRILAAAESLLAAAVRRDRASVALLADVLRTVRYARRDTSR